MGMIDIDQLGFETEVSPEVEIYLKAGCVWELCDLTSPKEDIERWSKMYGITYEQSMMHRDKWMKIQKMNNDI